MYEGCFRISHGALRVAFCHCDVVSLYLVAGLHGGGHESLHLVVLLVAVVAVALAVYLEEAVEGDYLARCDELLRGACDVDVDGGLLQFGIGHLCCCCAFPDEVVESALLTGAVYLLLVHVCRAYCLVRLLCALGVGGIVAWLAVLLAVECRDGLLRRADAELREVNGVGTHVCDATVLVESLCHHHGLRHGEPELSCRLLLEGGGGERWCRRAA